MDLVSKISSHLALHYETLQEFFIWPVLKLCERTSKILADRAKASLLVLMQHPWPLKVVMTRLLECKTSQSKSLRLCVVEALATVITHVPQDALLEYEEQLARVLIDFLQDAAETVRAGSRSLYAQFAALFPTSATEITGKLPSSVLKAMQGFSGASPAAPTSGNFSVRSFLASKRVVTTSDSSSISAKSGPQRVVSRPQSSSSVATSILGTPHTLRSEKNVAAKVPVRLGKPSVSSSLVSVGTSIGSKLPSSSSLGTLPSVGIRPSPLPPSASLGKLPTLVTSSLPLAASGSSLTTGQPNYRRLLGDFKEKLHQSTAWDSRCLVLDEFSTTVLVQDEFRSEIVNAKASKLDLFDIFLAGLLDVHHKVVHSILAYGRAILSIVPSEKHPSATSFASFAIIRLFKIIFDIQFRTRQSLLDEARQLIMTLREWLGSPVLYFECLVNSVTRQDRALGFKMRKEAYETLALFILSGDLPFTVAEESFIKLITNAVRKLAVLLTDPDETIKEAVASCIEGLVTKASLTNWITLVPFENRQYIETYMLRGSPASANPTSPIMTSIEMADGLSKDVPQNDDSCILPSHTMAIDEIVLDAELGISMKVRPRPPSTAVPPPISMSVVTPVKGRLTLDFDTPRHTQAMEEESAEEEKEQAIQNLPLSSDGEDEATLNREGTTDPAITIELLGLQ